MAKRRATGWWLVAGTIVLMQVGGRAESHGVVMGPSQGAIPARYELAAMTGGGGGGTVALGADGPSPEAGTGETSTDGGSRSGPRDRRNAPIESRPRDTSVNPSPTTGGGGGGGGTTRRRSAVVPVLRGNPNGVDAVQDATPTPGGGGGGAAPADHSPFIRVLPGGDAADWTRSPSPGTGR